MLAVYDVTVKSQSYEELVEKWLAERSIIAVERHQVNNGKGSADPSFYISAKSRITNCDTLYSIR